MSKRFDKMSEAKFDSLIAGYIDKMAAPDDLLVEPAINKAVETDGQSTGRMQVGFRHVKRTTIRELASKVVVPETGWKVHYAYFTRTGFTIAACASAGRWAIFW